MGPCLAANNGWSLFGWNANAWGTYFKTALNPLPALKEGSCFRQFAEEAFDPADAMGLQDQAIKATASVFTYIANGCAFCSSSSPSSSPIDDGYISAYANSDSWWGAFAKNFFSNFVSPDFYRQEFSSNGCLRTFVSASVNAANPASPSLASTGGAGTMAVSAAMRYNAAQAYAASRTNVLGGQGLIFPQKSILYNNILRGSAVTNLAEGGLGYVDAALFQGLVTEAQEAYRGTCH
jgi:hypothetical protein